MIIALRAKAYFPTKLLNYHFANAEAETETILVLALGAGQLPEVVKEFADIFLLNTAAGVHDFCQEETVVTGTGLFWNVMSCPAHPNYYTIPGACKLDRIPYQVKKDLLVAFLIGHNFLGYIRRDLEIQINSFLRSLEPHDSNNFLHGIPEVKITKTQLEMIILES